MFTPKNIQGALEELYDLCDPDYMVDMLPPKPVRIPLRQRLLHLRVQARQRAKQLREPRTSQKE